MASMAMKASKAICGRTPLNRPTKQKRLNKAEKGSLGDDGMTRLKKAS